jgi:type 1 glutamine amidotransferase
MFHRICKGIAITLALIITGIATAQDAPRILFLSKSSGFEHGVIKTDADGSNHVAKVLQQLADAGGAELVATKDASMINAETLKGFNLVIFYTTMDLTEEGSDGNPPMSKTGVAELKEWISNGGGFMGYHCATDTFHGKGGEVTPYVELIGGEFLTHGAQFRGTVKVVDETHPAMAATPQDWKINDEWYIFKNLNKKNMHVLAVLDPGTARRTQEKYDIPNYPITWVSTLGNGRIYYNGQGHREDVWADEDFQQTVVAAATWAMGQGDAQAEPNYKEVMKKHGGKK